MEMNLVNHINFIYVYSKLYFYNLNFYLNLHLVLKIFLGRVAVVNGQTKSMWPKFIHKIVLCALISYMYVFYTLSQDISIHILPNYFIFINTSGFNRFLFKSMKCIQEFSFRTPPLLTRYNYTAKQIYVYGNFELQQTRMNVKNCARYSEWRKNVNIPYYKSP